MTVKRLTLGISILLIVLAGCKGKVSNISKPDGVNNNKASNNIKGITKIIHIKAQPDSVAIDVSKTAVIVVDMENDFCSKGGLMDRIGAKISVIQNIIRPAKEFLAAARKAGIPVIYLKMGYNPDLSDIGAEDPTFLKRFYAGVGDTIKAPNGTIGRLLVRNTWNTEIIPALAPDTGDIILYKTRFSGFYKTKLNDTLKTMGIKNLMLIGCTTSVCVESTARDAMFRDYVALILKDCTAEPDGLNFVRTNHEASIFMLQAEFGWVSDSPEIIRAISKIK